jgi:hypothetical protein
MHSHMLMLKLMNEWMNDAHVHANAGEKCILTPRVLHPRALEIVEMALCKDQLRAGQKHV